MRFHHVGQAHLELLTSSDPPASRTGFHHVGQASLELLASGDPPASASQSVGITGARVQSPDLRSASQVQGILLRQPPEYLELQASTITPS
ncbi:hypothetical protein AAY473_012385 [Plecturocebus cupreus]